MTVRARSVAFAATLGTALALALPGCKADTSPPAGYGDFVPAPDNDPQISVLPPELRPWLAFHAAFIDRDGERPMSVQVPVRNLAARKYLVDYRILFYDDKGMELSPTMGWTMVPLEQKEIVRLKASALDARAVAYRLEIKWAR